MTRWTMDQVRQVRGLRAEARVDPSLIAQERIDVMAATRWKLVRRLIDMAHPFAVEPHEADFAFAEREDDDEAWRSIVVRCWWEPDVRTVEILGGHKDGTLFEVERPGDSIRLVPPTPQFGAYLIANDEDPASPLESLPPLIAEMTGWDETNRRWVYEVR